jgi:HSP20 family protein
VTIRTSADAVPNQYMYELKRSMQRVRCHGNGEFHHMQEERNMRLIHWEPFKGTDDFFRSTTPSLFGRWPRLIGREGQAYEWSPAADICETDEEYLVRADLPGVEREDVKVSLEDGVLTIEGERNQEKEEKGKTMHRVERFYGIFCRRFNLPEDAEASRIQAETKDGVLNVHIPKSKVMKAKAVEIKVN